MPSSRRTVRDRLAGITRDRKHASVQEPQQHPSVDSGHQQSQIRSGEPAPLPWRKRRIQFQLPDL